MINATKKWIFLKISGAILVPLMIWFVINLSSIYDQEYSIVVNFFTNTTSKFPNRTTRDGHGTERFAMTKQIIANPS